MKDLISQRLGTVKLKPNQAIVAGTVGQWRLVYTVGSYGVDSGGTIKLAWPLVSDWEKPQFDQPDQPGYTTVRTNGAAKLRSYYHAKAHVRPWTPCLVIDIYDGSLAPGDTVIVVLGDRREGSPGIRAQTFQESNYEFRFLVDPTNAAQVQRLPTSPIVPIVAGRPTELLCLLPTQAVVDMPVEVFVKGQDTWGNPTPAPDAVQLSWVGNDGVTAEGKWLTAVSPGTGYVEAVTEDGVYRCRSNPITFYPTEPGLKRYWGDLHGQTKATVGTGSEDEYFAFGRDVARLDFMSHQGNDFQMTDAYWRHLNETTRTFNENGRFIVFPGYEWSANTPAGGDWNVFYLEEGQPILRSSHWLLPNVAEDERTPAHPANVMFERLHQHVDKEKVLLAAHVGGRYANIRQYFDQDLAGLVEVVSDWGMFEWILWDAFDKGYIVGVMGNSDGHRCRPGAESPGASDFGIRNGLTCVLAASLTRESIFAALKARCCYATTGPRIDLSFQMSHPQTGDVYEMGSIVETSSPLTVQASVIGTAALEALILYCGKEVIHVAQAAAFDNLATSNRIRVSWRGSRLRSRGRRVVWDGAVQVTGTQIMSAETVAFDSLTDGISSQTDDEIRFISSTTGDMDGINLELAQAQSGMIVFDSKAGQCQVDLSQLENKHVFDFGGLDMQVCIERYPEFDALTAVQLHLETTVTTKAGQTTPYFVKAVQSDGHVAWASPIYIRGDTQPRAYPKSGGGPQRYAEKWRYAEEEKEKNR